jgi:hypothetical protein
MLPSRGSQAGGLKQAEIGFSLPHFRRFLLCLYTGALSGAAEALIAALLKW